MPDDPELGHLLEESGPPASDATLTAIGVRAACRRTKRLRALSACAVAIGCIGIGFGAVATATRPSPTTAATRTGAIALPSSGATDWTSRPQSLGKAPKGLRWTAESSASAPAAASPSNGSSAAVGTDFCTDDGCPGLPAPIEGPLTRLFDRTAGDVTVRAFTEHVGFVHPVPMIPAGSDSSTSTSTNERLTCGTSSELLLEVSNPGAVGTVSVPSVSSASTSGPFEVVDSSVVGVAESSPIEVVAVEVSPGATTVQASFADGASDAMAVDDDWAVLVDDGSSPLPATITALGTSGSPLGTTVVTSDAAIAEPNSCISPLVPPASGAASSSGSAG